MSVLAIFVFIVSVVPFSDGAEDNTVKDSVISIELTETLVFSPDEGHASAQKINDLAGRTVCSFIVYDDPDDTIIDKDSVLNFVESITITMRSVVNCHMFKFIGADSMILLGDGVCVTLNFGEGSTFTNDTNAALYSRYDLTIKGKGTMNINSDSSVGISNGIHCTLEFFIVNTTVKVKSNTGNGMVNAFIVDVRDCDFECIGKNYGISYADFHSLYLTVRNAHSIIIGDTCSVNCLINNGILKNVDVYVSDNIDGSDKEKIPTYKNTQLKKYLEVSVATNAPSGGSSASFFEEYPIITIGLVLLALLGGSFLLLFLYELVMVFSHRGDFDPSKKNPIERETAYEETRTTSRYYSPDNLENVNFRSKVTHETFDHGSVRKGDVNITIACVTSIPSAEMYIDFEKVCDISQTPHTFSYDGGYHNVIVRDSNGNEVYNQTVRMHSNMSFMLSVTDRGYDLNVAIDK